MSANFNQVMLIGRLTRDPELRYTPAGTAYCKWGMATNSRMSADQAGNRREEVYFADCTVFGKTAETAAQYLKKGKPCLVVGRLKLNEWEDQSGQKKSRTEVIVDKFQFLDAAPGGDKHERPGDPGPPDDIPF